MSGSFRVGVNYWPAATAMRWWRRFDREQVSRDFAEIRAAGGDTIRFFLLWEDFQPRSDTVSEAALALLRAVADAAGRQDLAIIPTLFTGHMSGANFVPEWALGAAGSGRFRVVSKDRVVGRAIRNWYADELVGDAQALLARECARALAGHPALWGWDLGNENSNCCVPPTREAGRRWLDRIAGAIRSVDPSCHLTLGLHMEDLEEDRKIGPAEAAAVCDILSMHAYPIYTAWCAGPVDDALLGFAADLTRWLGGKDVLFAEFGAATKGDDEEATRVAGAMLLHEGDAAEYTTRAFGRLRGAGAIGGLVWCFSDYPRAIWHEPPLDTAPHERHFGLWRADGSPKPAVTALASARGAQLPMTRPAWAEAPALERFYQAPRENLARLYAVARAEPSLARPVL